MVTSEINFNVQKNNYIIIYARKGEINARSIVASFKDTDGNNLDLSDKSVTFYALKPDKTQIYNNCTVDSVNGTASITLSSQMVSVSGIVDCEYQIFEGDNLLLKVSGLKIVVEDSCDFSEALESTSECNALIKAINEAEGFCENIGNLSNLTTTEKNTIVGAVNEVNGICENIGDLSDLTTTEKNTIVGAVNEVNGKVVPISQGGTGSTTATGARTNLEVMKAVELYYNTSGTQSTIPLSDSVANYTAVTIYSFNSDNVMSDVTIWNNGGSSFLTTLVLATPYVMNNENRVSIAYSQLSVSADTITWDAQTYTTFRPSGTQVTVGATTTRAHVYRVVGYKY